MIFLNVIESEKEWSTTSILNDVQFKWQLLFEN
jgi:hypothetical protein